MVKRMLVEDGFELCCPNCGSTKLVKFGMVFTAGKVKTQRFQCQDCGDSFTRPNRKAL